MKTRRQGPTALVAALLSDREIRQPDTRRRRLTDQGFPGVAGCRCGPHLPLSAQSGTICPVCYACRASHRTPHLPVAVKLKSTATAVAVGVKPPLLPCPALEPL